MLPRHMQTSKCTGYPTEVQVQQYECTEKEI